jgi:hypothetical protein
MHGFNLEWALSSNELKLSRACEGAVGYLLQYFYHEKGRKQAG